MVGKSNVDGFPSRVERFSSTKYHDPQVLVSGQLSSQSRVQVDGDSGGVSCLLTRLELLYGTQGALDCIKRRVLEGDSIVGIRHGVERDGLARGWGVELW